MNNQLANDQFKVEQMSFGLPKGYNVSTHDGQQVLGQHVVGHQMMGQQGMGQQVLGQQVLGQQVLGQQVLVQQQGGKGQYKEFEQPRYYGSSMVMQSPYVQGGGQTTGQPGGQLGGQLGGPMSGQGAHGTPYMNQAISYPAQQQIYETRPVNSYLLIHQGQDQGQIAASFYGAARSRGPPEQPVVYEGFIERLQQSLPVPPMSQAITRPEINLSLNQRRARRKSKFSKEQDDSIVELKRKGKTWVEIAEMSGVGSYLAARNRYQVIVGQQGNNNSSSWDNEDKSLLRKLLDEAEIEKWKFIAAELTKATGKPFSDRECRETVRMLFWADPASFGVNEDTVNECFKEKKVTERANEQQSYIDNERQYAQPFFSQPSSATNASNTSNSSSTLSNPPAPVLHSYHSYNSKSSPESIDNYPGNFY
ncbi:DEHA2F17182p [Debaryomyces hansenii CBS767]|uniref:DEHA2F17182p n=1 Tax=Debaryomyces hansenii (strain ATCC 36239 / CBS 767 / BCRC 21394 / JCM 1990 / NBRC 0083 / IGC 2968) TaxID=284592 RepID=Q6BL13_DEBHA|nr:DEHA2F17182p [Debaryomyces hansenii CBS767]CAG89490.2 DEHA2F17182p [Debaryomyces hansenii CBS767]|eukprot:XP_461108.2 DEHA2F17182p [Debaryomyces hansenii CBS767]